MGAENHYLAHDELTAYHKDKIAELRARCADDLKDYPEYGNDFQLLRWLMGWDYKIDIIVPKIQETIRTAVMLGMADHSLLEPSEINALGRELCNVAEHYPGGLMGTDDEGNVIFMQPLAQVHPKSLAKSGCVSELFRLSMMESEFVAKLIYRAEAKTGRKLGAKMIIDLEGFSMDLLYMPTLLIYKELLTLLQEHFPDTARKIYVVNCPMMIKTAYALIQPVLAKQTREKVEFLGSNWKEILVKDLGAHNIYQKWGGTKPSDLPCGDIRMGGKVPEKMWWGDKNPMEEGLTKINVPARNKTEVKVHCEAGKDLNWLWKVNSGDLDYSIFHNGKQLYPTLRLSTEFHPEVGKLPIKESGEYVLVFDNSHGTVWSKDVKYKTWQ